MPRRDYYIRVLVANMLLRIWPVVW